MIRIVALTGTSSENLSGMFRALLSPSPYMSDRGESCDTEIDFADESTENLIIPYVWAQIEPSLAIICASIITYKPFFDDIKSCFGFFSPQRRRPSDDFDQILEHLSPRRPFQNSRAVPWSLTTSGSDLTIQDMDQKQMSGRTHVNESMPSPAPLCVMGDSHASSQEDGLGITVFAPVMKPECFA